MIAPMVSVPPDAAELPLDELPLLLELAVSAAVPAQALRASAAAAISAAAAVFFRNILGPFDW